MAGAGDAEDGVVVGDVGDVGELDDVSDDVGAGDVVSSGDVVSLVMVGAVDVGLLCTSVRGTHVYDGSGMKPGGTTCVAGGGASLVGR